MKRLISGAFMVLVGMLVMVGIVGGGSVAAQPVPGPQQLEQLQQQLQQIQITLNSLQGAVMKIPPTWREILPASTRFVLVMNDAAVLDVETGLIWERTPNPKYPQLHPHNWLTSLEECNIITVSNRKGWRLPTIQELASLVDPSSTNPSLPVGHPFNKVQSTYYWSASTDAARATHAYVVNFGGGYVTKSDKSNDFYRLCVRGGQGVDPQ